MKKSKFTESKMVQALKEHEVVKNADDIYHQPRINRNTLYNWKKKYSEMDLEILRKYKELGRDNSQLKRIYADLSLDYSILKEVIERKL